jgi:glutamate/tyrosine decarboxylase-like PLP-dependent enzyme
MSPFLRVGFLEEYGQFMSSTVPTQVEITLDPQDWSNLRALGHQMLDDMFSYLETVRERPVWKPLPKAVKTCFMESIPLEGRGPESAYEEFKENILPFPLGNIHPRFWSWVCGTGSPGGMLAEMLCAAMNSNVHGADHAAVYVEQQVLSWLKDALGYPMEASGLLVGSGSIANFVGLAVARNAKAGWNVKAEGLCRAAKPLVMYCSAETHNSVQKSAEALGLGTNGIRYVATDEDFRIDQKALREAVAADRRAGKLPICVIGNAGTVNSGAIDDLQAIADFCKAEDLWFHVDGAFGATAALSPSLRPLLRGMDQADSLAFDLHKWMYMPYGVGCTLVRSRQKHRDTFGYQAAYLDPEGRGLAGGPIWFSHYGLTLSRPFRALKVWFSLKEHGLKTHQALVEQNVAQCKYLGDLINADTRLELLAPIPLNVVCFRFKSGLDDETKLASINKEIILRLQESGVAAPSSTVIGGHFAIRVANVNHRSRREDFELLASEVARLGTEIMAERSNGS